MLAVRVEPTPPRRVSRAQLPDRLHGRGAGLVLTSVLALAVTVALVGTQVVLHPGRGVVGSNPSSDFQIMT